MKQAETQEFLESIGLAATPAQIAQIQAYEQILISRGPEVGVVARSDIPRLRERHILDCARAAAVVPESGLSYDLGSGGGLPGILVAILRPGLSVRLVERRGRRVGFLEWVVQELRLANASVEASMIESLPHATADACLARALAPLEGSWAMALPLLKPGGTLVYFAGQSAQIPAEVEGASSIVTQAGEMLETAGPLVIITR